MDRAADDDLFVRLYIDTDISPRLARVLRSRGYDAVSAYEVGNEALSDEEHMAFAASQRRALLTCNAQDFTPIYEQYWFAGTEHAGVMVSEQLELGEMVRRVLVLLDTVTAEEMRHTWRNLAEFASRSGTHDA